MQVGLVCTRHVTCLEPTDTALRAAHVMREECVGAIVVVERREGKRIPLGIVTDRDLVVRLLAVEPERFSRARLAELMPDSIVSCREADEVSDALEAMKRHGVRRMPVIDSSGDLCGLVALDDALRALADDMARIGLLVSGQRLTEARRNDEGG